MVERCSPICDPSRNQTKSRSLQIKVLIYLSKQLSFLLIPVFHFSSTSKLYNRKRRVRWLLKGSAFCCESCKGLSENSASVISVDRENGPKDRNIAAIVTRSQPQHERWTLVKSHACESEITRHRILDFTVTVNEEQEENGSVKFHSIRTLYENYKDLRVWITLHMTVCSFPWMIIFCCFSQLPLLCAVVSQYGGNYILT